MAKNGRTLPLSIAFYDIWRRRPTVWNASSPEASAL